MGSGPISIISTLPFDIWYHISKFLLDEQLRQLYSVNRSFLYIALSLRYREVFISGRRGLVGDVDAAKYAKILDNPALGKYVRWLELDLNNSPIFQGAFKKPTRIGALKSFAAHSHVLLSPWRRQKARDPIRLVKSFIASLDQLTSITVKWYWGSSTHPSHDLHADIFLPGWSVFGPRLRSLSLHLTIESFLYLFQKDLHFPQLDTLTLELFKHYDPYETAAAQSSPKPLLHFIHHHSKTLKSLRIISLYPIDGRTFYFGIGRLPSLEVVKLEEDQSYSILAICEFLLLNSATLTEFRWAPKLSPSWATTPIHPTRTGTPLDIHLPKLKKLSLNFQIFRKRSYDLGHILGYISRHAETLSSLALTGERLTQPEFCALLDTVITLQIRTLEVSLRCIASSTFPTVATYLPNLDTLVIEYDTIDPDVYSMTGSPNHAYMPKITVSDQFVRDMQVSSLKVWHLGTLFVKRRGSWRPYFYHPGGVVSREYLVFKAIVENIPRVEWYNGMYREEFLKLEVESREREQLHVGYLS